MHGMIFWTETSKWNLQKNISKARTNPTLHQSAKRLKCACAFQAIVEIGFDTIVKGLFWKRIQTFYHCVVDAFLIELERKCDYKNATSPPQLFQPWRDKMYKNTCLFRASINFNTLLSLTITLYIFVVVVLIVAKFTIPIDRYYYYRSTNLN